MPKDKKKTECQKAKNPCKICLQPVTGKKGVQCQGACEAWVHYECLNYTPGKIKDIETGLITITCPCPDCKSSVPKEYRKDEPFTCNNVMCPANNPPCCEAYDCQANEVSRATPARCPPPGTLRTCGEQSCCDYVAPPSAFRAPPTVDACMEGLNMNSFFGNNNMSNAPVLDECLGKIGQPGPGGKCQHEAGMIGMQGIPGMPGIPGMQRMHGMQGMPGLPGMPNRACAPGVAASPATPGMPGMPGMQMPGQAGQVLPPDVVQHMCKTIGELAHQLNSLMASLNAIGGGGAAGVGMPAIPGANIKPCGSDGVTCGGNAGCKKCANKPPPQNTVNGTVKKPGCTGGCGQAGQSGCAQPCHCPGQPAQK